MDAVVASVGQHSLNQYGSGAGLPDLVKALKDKLAAQNDIKQVQSMHPVTSPHLHVPPSVTHGTLALAIVLPSVKTVWYCSHILLQGVSLAVCIEAFVHLI